MYNLQWDTAKTDIKFDGVSKLSISINGLWLAGCDSERVFVLDTDSGDIIASVVYPEKPQAAVWVGWNAAGLVCVYGDGTLVTLSILDMVSLPFLASF